jgi:FHS family L-fucose permease-like MFS transporter
VGRTRTEDGRGTRFAFAAVSALFFAWGFISSNNDPLIAALRAAFHLSYTEALLTQIIFFVAFGLISLPAAWLSGRFGQVDTTLAALLVMTGGCFLVSMATGAATFAPILGSLFIVASGYTALQVAANPLAANLGSPGRSHFHLSLAQTFNSLGVVAGAQFGSRVMLGPHTAIPGGRIGLLSAVDHAYEMMAAALVVLALVWLLVRGAVSRAQDNRGLREQPGSLVGLLKSPWAVFGAIAIGLYVGAEVSIGSIMINFLNQEQILGIPLEQAGRYLANLYWGGALAGRIIGTLLLARVRAARLLAACAILNSVLCTLALLSSGPLAGYAALAVGLFNSIMFPTIFTITLERSGVPASATSGLLCLSISAGAVLPLAVGVTADHFGLSAAFSIPLMGYLMIGSFAVIAAVSAVPPRASTAAT